MIEIHGSFPRVSVDPARLFCVFCVGTPQKVLANLFTEHHNSPRIQQTNWEIQVLIKQQRRDHAMEQSWQPTDADDDDDDPEALWVPKCKSRARASFGHSMHSTALWYPVFKVVSQHLKCVRRLAVRAMQPNSRSQLNIITNTLGSAKSAYSQDCTDLKHLPGLRPWQDTFATNTGTSTLCDFQIGACNWTTHRFSSL